MPNYLPGETDYYANSRDEMLAFLPAHAKTILDVGCGQGNFLKALLRKNPNAAVYGVELNQKAVDLAHKITPHVHQADMEALPQFWEAGSFDAIYCNDVLEHLRSPEIVLQHLQQFLAPNGVLIVSLPNVRYIKTLFQLLIKKDWAYEESGILDRTHLRFYTQKSAARLLEESGYTVESVTGIHPTRIPAYPLFSLLTLGLFHDSRYMNYVVVARPCA